MRFKIIYLYPLKLFIRLLTINLCFVPYRPAVVDANKAKNVVTVAGQSYVDTEAGFLLNEQDLTNINKPVQRYIIRTRIFIYCINIYLDKNIDLLCDTFVLICTIINIITQ